MEAAMVEMSARQSRERLVGFVDEVVRPLPEGFQNSGHAAARESRVVFGLLAAFACLDDVAVCEQDFL
jgi:hypothetical protein